MFTWICPKCGKEVPPSYSDCPNCAPSPSAATVEQPPALPSQQPNASPASPDAKSDVELAAVFKPAEPPAAPAPAPAARRPGHVSIPLWLFSLVFAAALIVIGLTFIVLRNSARTAPAQQATAPLESPAAPAAASESNPVFKNVELTGLRLTEDAQQKAFVQVVLVNHSGGDLGEVSAKVNLKAVAKQTQEPVGTFALKATLGPYESKEVKAPLETKLRVYELPDWQFLRAEIAQ